MSFAAISGQDVHAPCALVLERNIVSSKHIYCITCSTVLPVVVVHFWSSTSPSDTLLAQQAITNSKPYCGVSLGMGNQADFRRKPPKHWRTPYFRNPVAGITPVVVNLLAAMPSLYHAIYSLAEVYLPP